MAVTLASMISRVEDFVLDTSNVKFTEANITDALRQAVADMSLAAGTVLTLDGLDGAAATTIPPRLEGALVTGAAGFLGLMRAGSRVDWENSEDGSEFPAIRLHEWGSYWLKYFRGRVDDYYPAETGRMYDQRRTSAPFASWGDDFGERGS